jgi:uncharacterized protein (UPF0261 family)
MMPAVTDIAGLNRISRAGLANAAAAIAGMARAPTRSFGQAGYRADHVGVTTTGVTQVVEQLKADYDCLVFTPPERAAAQWRNSPTAACWSASST